MIRIDMNGQNSFHFLISAVELIFNSLTIGTRKDIIFLLKVQLAQDIS